MLKWILAAVAALFVTAATRAQNILNLQPSAWNSLTSSTDYTAAQFGLNFISGTSTLGAANKATYKEWDATVTTTGGQYVSKGASNGYILLGNNQSLIPVASTDGTVFGGTTGAYTGYATISIDVMFQVSDPSTFAQADSTTIAELAIGSGSAYRAQFKIVNHTATGGAIGRYKQKCGVKIYNIPTGSAQKITGFANADTIDPELEFNKVYTITLQVGASATVGWNRIWVDKTLHSQRTAETLGGALNSVTALGAAGNTISMTSTVASTGVECRIVPRIMVGNDSTWYTGLSNPTPASNVGTTRVFQTAFTPMATETTGYPFTITKTVGTPTLTATSYGTTAPTLGRSRFVFSGASVGDTVRISSADELTNLESDSSGNQFVGWASEYIPTGSAVWGIRATNDASSYAISVNYSNGILREGSTAGSGTVLFALNPLKVYGIVFSGRTSDSTARVYAINLSDEYRRVPLIKSAALTTAWPSTLGVQSAVYVCGATVPEASTMLAGRTWGLMVGDSFGSAYAYGRGTFTLSVTGASGTTTGTVTETSSGGTGTSTTTTTSGGIGITVGSFPNGTFMQGGGALTYAGGGTATGGAIEMLNTIICPNNNVGFHVSNGSENHFIPNGWRPSKPVSTSIPDVTYQWSIGRSGLRIEDMGGTIDACKNIRGACVFVPSFAYNSLSGITASTASTMLTSWGTQARLLRDNLLTGNNTVIWPSAPINTSIFTSSAIAAGAYQTVGTETFLSGTYAELTKNMSVKTGYMYSCDMYPVSSACFVGFTDNIHIAGSSEGGRFYVGYLFGNPAGGFTTGALRRAQ